MNEFAKVELKSGQGETVSTFPMSEIDRARAALERSPSTYYLHYVR